MRVRVSVWVASACLLAVCIALGVAVRMDAPFALALNEGVRSLAFGMHGGLDGFVVAITQLGDPVVITLTCLAFAIALAAFRRRREALLFACCFVVSAVVAHGLKLAFGIERPQGPLLVDLPHSASYPSAHACCVLAAYGCAGLTLVAAAKTERGKRIGWAAFAVLMILAILVGLSRIYVGVHWPTDVLGGFMLGAAVLLPFAYLLKEEPADPKYDLEGQ